MNLAIIIPFLEKYGGAERYLIECIRRWQDRHDLTLYAVEVNDELLAEHGIDKKIPWCKLSPYFEGAHSMLLNAVLLPKIWQKEIGLHDLYHAHLWPTHLIDIHPMVWFAHEPFRILNDLRYEQNMEHVGKEAVRNVHIYPKYNYDRIGNHLFEAYLSSIEAIDKTAKPERIVGNSFYMAKHLQEVYGTPVEDVVYPGVEPEIVIDLPTDQNLFVTISQLWLHKRISLLIEAIALTDDAQLVIIGSGPEKENLVATAVKLGVEDRVFFLSGLSNHELSLVLARACAFLFASVNEPFGIVILEAMAAGKPVIAVNQGGYTEACQPEYSFLVPPFPSAFAERITFLQRNPDIARQMGAAGRLAAPKFSWQRCADELEAILIDTWKKSNASKPTPSSAMADRILTGIQYYLWYGDGFGASHWNDNAASGHVADKPMLGYYSSAKGQTINYHLDLFEEMGLDYVVLNLHIDGAEDGGLELIGIQHVLDIAKRRNSPLRFTIQIAPYTDNAENILRIVRMITKLYAKHPNYLQIDGQPVLFWFWSTAHDGNKQLISALQETAGGYINMAASLRLPDPTNEDKLTFGFFKGFVPYSPLELSDEKNWNKVWHTAYKNAEQAGMIYRMASLSPGYDDTGLDASMRVGNPYRKAERKDGATYQTNMKFIETLPTPPHLVMISTFNEFHENTHIEPSLRNGKRYIDMTKDFITRIKTKRRNQTVQS